MAFQPASTTPNLTTRERSARSWNHSQEATSQMTRTELFKVLCDRGLTYPRPGKIWMTPFSSWFKVDWLCIFHQNIPGRFFGALKTSSYVKREPKGRKSLHIVEGNQLKQEGMCSVKNALGVKGSCLNRATLAFNLTDKMGNQASRLGDWHGIKIPENLNPRNQASRLRDWYGIEIPKILNPRNQASRPGNWLGIKTPEILHPRNQASRPGDCQGIDIPEN
ncbi:uncharacterized protein G2W53_028929 [Senna tora]|uniref:Uncharacterized protein n=1 Tax=Senna tora TaxID=362788 RepID=A0A834T3M1_9FABA|nr:uncharacterized protein G2W53_028929 [Senna tora]